MFMSQIVSIDAGKKQTFAVDSAGKVYVTGDNYFRQLGIAQTERVMKFA